MTVGFGTTCQGEYTFNRGNAAADRFGTPDHWLYRGVVDHDRNDDVALQLDMRKLTDEQYFERVGNATNRWATPHAVKLGPGDSCIPRRVCITSRPLHAASGWRRSSGSKS